MWPFKKRKVVQEEPETICVECKWCDVSALSRFAIIRGDGTNPEPALSERDRWLCKATTEYDGGPRDRLSGLRKCIPIVSCRDKNDGHCPDFAQWVDHRGDNAEALREETIPPRQPVYAHLGGLINADNEKVNIADSKRTTEPQSVFRA
jgi:hypothetical protein